MDVRRYPVSRRHPQFTRPTLAASLAAAGIAYRHEPDLGGHREARPDSLNTVWPPALRGYADHMASAAFADAVRRLLAEAEHERVAVMCAEADPSHCHRQMLADALVLAGCEVRHIVDGDRVAAPHVVHPDAAVAADGHVWYAPRQRCLG